MNDYVMIGNDSVITGLVRATTLNEAQADAAQMGLTGTILTRADFELTPEYADMVLNETRGNMVARIAAVWQGVGADYLDVQDSALEPSGLAKKTVAQYATTKTAWVATASQVDLDAYDPTTDAQLQV